MTPFEAMYGRCWSPIHWLDNKDIALVGSEMIEESWNYQNSWPDQKVDERGTRLP